jgi:hypothetical protein
MKFLKRFDLIHIFIRLAAFVSSMSNDMKIALDNAGRRSRNWSTLRCKSNNDKQHLTKLLFY